MPFRGKSTQNGSGIRERLPFYILRRAFMRTFNLKRSDVSLDMRFRPLIPTNEEREVWPCLQAAVCARRWPDLSRPVWMTRLITASSLALLIPTVLASLILHWGLTSGIIIGIILTIVFACLTVHFTIPFKLYITTRLRTVRDLVPLAITSDSITWTREQVSTLVKEIVMEQLVVPESKYTEDSHFIDDFGMC